MKRAARMPGACAAISLLIVDWVGCVSTEDEPVIDAAFCLTSKKQPDPWSSVVHVITSLRKAGEVSCSGVVVAPTLVLTNISCLMLPPTIEEADLDADNVEMFTDFSSVHIGDVDYDSDCRSADTWSPIESGDFSERVTETVDSSAVTVSTILDGRPSMTSNVRRILVSRTESRCWDSLAILVLDQGLEAEPAVVRIDEKTVASSPVTLSGFWIEDNLPSRHEVPATVQAVSLESEGGTAPPRSLALSGFICRYEHGGGVFDNDSGALIGVISSERDFECIDEEAGTIATRLAPFRRMLADAASDTSETLRIERHADAPSAELWPDCLGE
jgi:hypothetical protein